MKKINELINDLVKVKNKYNEVIQPSVSNKQLGELDKLFTEQFSVNLSEIYKNILQITNGFNENGVFLYGSETALIIGYDDVFLSGIIDSNLNWHTNEDFAKFIFYADSDLYLFVQEIETKVFSFRPRDNFDEVLLETTDDELFFQIILECALEGGIEEKYCE
ncbi:hypothetical protein H4K35_11830 [Myroides sp. NP-2]|uniref:YrhA family protein n=1 Tax=Myroides sp. NP-2 TaxID=2759945 RepID=UPI0015F7A732|nr:YrhA family protein [Myroides sp. NP-2]MBB1150795.1 hypothetical protein [Myroides sp. NP-2]